MKALERIKRKSRNVDVFFSLHLLLFLILFCYKIITFAFKCLFRWLMDNIIRNYEIINERVQLDMANYALLVEKNRDEWRSKMESRADSPEEIPVVENGDPFKPISSVVVKKYSCIELYPKILVS